VFGLVSNIATAQPHCERGQSGLHISKRYFDAHTGGREWESLADCEAYIHSIPNNESIRAAERQQLSLEDVVSMVAQELRMRPQLGIAWEEDSLVGLDQTPRVVGYDLPCHNDLVSIGQR
jgi:hypothetical protein